MQKLRQLGKRIIDRRDCRTFTSSGDVSRGSGAFGKKEHAQEEQFFRQKEHEEIEKLKKELTKKGSKKRPVSKDGKQEAKDKTGKKE